ncbi:YCR102C-like protein [Saccharomyces cerevisiae x Saccharomyces kudriavzevii VIN7]|uniref:YCR102C-like protein n=1 Tax=Saccharomyces cerevisiae x Saccharomyces kudriavzevii (strain VIN7) TaxID=1095631 RepID=H0GV69_SACCK|nr:YCR102C-like protein [Saccharomyces cerevisiae x Saccharomyces kudriavzevii VIN7]
MSTLIPETMKAVVIENGKAVVKEGVPIPKLEEGFVLIKTFAVAGNPTDWAHIEYKVGPPGSILGCDAAGQVVELGPGVNPEDFSVGDYIYGFIHGSSVRFPSNGAFAEYSAISTAFAYKSFNGLKLCGENSLPSGPVRSLEGAATIPVSLTTAGLVLTNNLGLSLEWEPSTPQRDHPILLWGGATSLGQLIIQLAKKLNGFTKIIVVASRKHEEQLKEYGADELFDYHDFDVVEQIKKKYKNIPYLVDCVANQNTLQQVYKCAADKLDATIVELTNLGEENVEKENRRLNVTIDKTRLYAIGGHEIPFGGVVFPADPEARTAAIKFVKFINPRINDGKIHHIPVKIYKNGLYDIPHIIEDIKKGKNSGEKLVAVLN